MKKILSIIFLMALAIGLLGSCKKEDTKVSVTGVTLDKTELTLTVGDSDVKLTATVAPDDATDKVVNWSSDKPDVAVVDANGNVHAIAPGTACITVTTTDGGKTATCVVTVNAEIKTIADVLATVDGGFPYSSSQTTIPDNAWVADVPNNRKCYAYTSTSGSTTALLLRIPEVGDVKGNYTALLTSLDVTKENNCYTVTYNNNYGKLTFNMAENILTSINYEPIKDGAKPFDGTYTAPPAN